MQTNTPRFKLAQSGSVEEKIDVLVSKKWEFIFCVEKHTWSVAIGAIGVADDC